MATIFGVDNHVEKENVFDRNGHRLGDTILGNVTTPNYTTLKDNEKNGIPTCTYFGVQEPVTIR